jgi:hypothetical protein
LKSSQPNNEKKEFIISKLFLFFNIISLKTNTFIPAMFQRHYPIPVVVLRKICKIPLYSCKTLTSKKEFEFWEETEVRGRQIWRIGWMFQQFIVQSPQFSHCQVVCDEILKHDAIVTLHDFNAKLGREQLYKDIIGRHSVNVVTKSNGLRLLQYATINNFKVLSTWFPRKDIHKGTWRIPGTNNTNQTDHILASNKRWAIDIENVRTYRGANSDSDHFLVGTRLKQKIALMTRNGINNCKRWNVD